MIFTEIVKIKSQLLKNKTFISLSLLLEHKSKYKKYIYINFNKGKFFYRRLLQNELIKDLTIFDYDELEGLYIF